ncbi:hypothetical protein, partial [Nostoc sp. 'Peltigera membranacea cyanobiont' 213]|uniref:hypothetical protein n=1 Tax=Nostoc sp. 'Peltigera membranacea cyanobiont' 213 TaxID=2014530 RepID=UPI001CB8AD42
KSFAREYTSTKGLVNVKLNLINVIWTKTRGLADGVQRVDGKVPLIALLNMGATNNYGTHPSTQYVPNRRSLPNPCKR